MVTAVKEALTKRLSSAIRADPDVILYAARVSVWGRWLIWLVSVFNLTYRPADWYPSEIGHAFLHVPLVTLNGLVHFRLLTNRPVTWRWMLVLSAMDIVLITADIVIGDGFKSFTFLAYYPALAGETFAISSGNGYTRGCGEDGSVACRAQLWGRGRRLRHPRRHSSWHICRCADEETWEKAQEAKVHRTS